MKTIMVPLFNCPAIDVMDTKGVSHAFPADIDFPLPASDAGGWTYRVQNKCCQHPEYVCNWMIHVSEDGETVTFGYSEQGAAAKYESCYQRVGIGGEYIHLPQPASMPFAPKSLAVRWVPACP